MLLLLGVCAGRAAAAGDAILEARMLPPILAGDVVNLRALPASAAAIAPGIYLERTESTYHPPEQVFEFVARNRGGVLLGRSTRLAILADDVVRAVALASPRGWGVVFGYEASRVAEGRSEQGPILDSHDSYTGKWMTTTDQRFQFGAGWRVGDEATRAYEIGLLGSLFDARSQERNIWQWDTLTATDKWSGTRRQDLGVGLTLRTLSSRGGPQVGCSFLYEEPRPSFHDIPRLHQWQREARLDGAWRVQGTRLDDLVAGATLQWSDQSVLVASRSRDKRYESEERETIYAGIAFISIEESIVPGLVLRAGARAPARIATERKRERRVYSDGSHGLMVGGNEVHGSVREPEFAVGLGGEWRRFRVDGQLKSSLEAARPVVRWSVTVLL